MSANSSKPVRLAWILFFLALLIAYGFGACEGRRQAENPPAPSRFPAP